MTAKLRGYLRAPQTFPYRARRAGAHRPGDESGTPAPVVRPLGRCPR
jgi:hypothetical protein